MYKYFEELKLSEKNSINSEKTLGCFLTLFQKKAIFLYLGYPPNNSSAPSPDIATVIFFFTNLNLQVDVYKFNLAILMLHI